MSNKRTSVRSLKGNMAKNLLRNIEVPLNSTKHRRSVLKNPTDNDFFPKSSKPEEINKFAVPQLNTALDIIKQMENLKIEKSERIISPKDLTPRSKAIVDQEVTKKLNFPLDKQVFEGLISINVNDSILIPEKRKPIKKKYIPKTSKDPIPELSDFLKPVEPLNHVIPLYDKPNILRQPENDNFKVIHNLYIQFGPDF